jgi:sugar/nucleoside kinase (ribokinase family)
MARAAREAGVTVSIDVDNSFDGLEELLPLVDICLASEDLPQRLTGVSDIVDALREIHSRFGCPIVGVTRGVVGSAVLCEDVLIETPAFEVPGGCVDTTGAGDAFRTGFLYGVLTGVSIEDCCLYANAVAALKCRDIGARNALPNPSEVQSLLATGP